MDAATDNTTANQGMGQLPAPTPTPAQTPPQPPPKQGFTDSFKRGLGGPKYNVDPNTGTIAAEKPPTTGMGKFGSILAGALTGALQGAAGAKQGQHGGAAFASGVVADQERRNQLKEQGIRVAQQSFQNKQSIQKTSDEHLEAVARTNKSAAETVGIVRLNDHMNKMYPLLEKEAGMNAEKLEQELKEGEQKLLKNSLDMRAYFDQMGLTGVDVDNWKDANDHAKDVVAGNSVVMPNGKEYTHDQYGAAVYKHDDLAKTPLVHDFTYKTYDGGDDGKSEVTHTLSGGSGTTLLDAFDAFQLGQGQLARQMAQKAAEAENALKTAQVHEAQAKAGLDEATAENLKKLGVNVPGDYVPDPNSFNKSQNDIQTDLASKNIQVPQNFATLYAMAHYDVSPDTFSPRPYNRPGSPIQMGRADAIAYIRTFINPNYDENNYAAVKTLEKNLADTGTKGKPGAQLISLNTFAGHVGQLWDLAEALNNGNVNIINDAKQRFKEQTGQAAPKNFDAVKTAVIGELGTLIKGGVPDVQELEDLGKTVNKMNSPAQLQGVMQNMAHLAGARAYNIVQQYVNYTGKLPPSTFNPQTIAAFKKMGIDASTFLPPGAKIPLGQNQGTANKTPQIPAGAAPAYDAKGNVIAYQKGNEFFNLDGSPYKPPATPQQPNYFPINPKQ